MKICEITKKNFKKKRKFPPQKFDPPNFPKNERDNFFFGIK